MCVMNVTVCVFMSYSKNYLTMPQVCLVIPCRASILRLRTTGVKYQN